MAENQLAALEGKKDDDQVWVENLLLSDSVYRSDKTKDKYEMAPTGFVGSVIPMPVKVAKEGYMRRAILRGKLRFLSDEEEAARSLELTFQDEAESDPAGIMKALEERASDVGARYTKKGLSDDGNEQKSITAKQVWAKKSDKGPSTVRRSDAKATPVVPGDEPEVIDAIVTETVKEGDPDWKSDTGV